MHASWCLDWMFADEFLVESLWASTGKESLTTSMTPWPDCVKFSKSLSKRLTSTGRAL